MIRKLAIPLALLLLAACKPGSSTDAAASSGVESGEHQHAQDPDDDSPHYTVTTLVEGDVDDPRLIVTFESTGPYHLNQDYPWRLHFEEGTTIEGGPDFTTEHATVTETSIRFEVHPLECEEGTIINAELSFALCSPGACEQATEPISWEICNMNGVPAEG